MDKDLRIAELEQMLEDARIDYEHIRLYQDEAERRIRNTDYILSLLGNLRESLEANIPTTPIQVRHKFGEWVEREQQKVGKTGLNKSQKEVLLTAVDILDDILAGRIK